MLCIYNVWYVTFPLRMFWPENLFEKISWFSSSILLFQKSKLDVLSKQILQIHNHQCLSFSDQKSRLLIIFGQNKRNVLSSSKLKFVKPEAEQITTKIYTHKCCQICLFNWTNLSSANCTQNWYQLLQVNYWTKSQSTFSLLAFLSWGRWAFCWLDHSANPLNQILTSTDQKYHQSQRV